MRQTSGCDERDSLVSGTTLDRTAQRMAQRDTSLDRWTIGLVMNIEDHRYTRRRRVAQDAVINESICVRHAQPRAIFRKCRCLRQIEIIIHQTLDEMIRQGLRAWICRAIRWTVPAFRNLQAWTDFWFLIGDVLDLGASENRDGWRQHIAEDLA